MFKELVETLEMHNFGVRAYELFAQRCCRSAQIQTDHAIFFLTLSLLAERFVNQYQESPLSIKAADAQKEKILNIIQQMEMTLPKDSDARIELLNTVSRDIMTE